MSSKIAKKAFHDAMNAYFRGLAKAWGTDGKTDDLVAAIKKGEEIIDNAIAEAIDEQCRNCGVDDKIAHKDIPQW